MLLGTVVAQKTREQPTTFCLHIVLFPRCHPYLAPLSGQELVAKQIIGYIRKPITIIVINRNSIKLTHNDVLLYPCLRVFLLLSENLYSWQMLTGFTNNCPDIKNERLLSLQPLMEYKSPSPPQGLTEVLGTDCKNQRKWMTKRKQSLSGQNIVVRHRKSQCAISSQRRSPHGYRN